MELLVLLAGLATSSAATFQVCIQSEELVV